MQLIPFVRAFYAFDFPLFYSHCNHERNVIVIPFVMGTHQGDPLGRTLFALTHFRALHSIANHFPSCLFPSIVDDIHIITPPFIVSTYEHFQIELYVIGFSIHPHKCVAWSPSSLSPNFNTPSQFTTSSKGIRILGVSLGISSFTSSFIKYAMLEDVQHVNFLLRVGDVQVVFGILTHCFMQRHLYLL